MVWVRVCPWPWGWGTGSWMLAGICLHSHSRRQSRRQRGQAMWGQGLSQEASGSPGLSQWSVEPWGSKPPPCPQPSSSKLRQGRAPPRRSIALQVKGRHPSTRQQSRLRPRVAPWASTCTSWIESKAPASNKVGRCVEIVHERLWHSWEPLKVRGCSLLKREVKPPAQPTTLPPQPAPKKSARAPAGPEPRGEEGGEQPREIDLPAAQEAGAAGAEEVQTPKAGAAEAEDEQTRRPEGEETPGAEGELTPEAGATKAEGEETSGTEGEKTLEVGAAEKEAEQVPGTEGEQTPKAEGEETPGAEGQEPQDQGQGQLLESSEVPNEEEKVSDDQVFKISEKRAEEGDVLEEGESDRNKENESFSAEGGNPSERTEAQYSEADFEATTDSPATTAYEVQEAYVNQKEHEEESPVKSDA